MAKKENFEQRLIRLEKLAEKIRDKDISLEEAMAGFEEGIILSQTLEKELEGFEQKVEILINSPAPQGGGEPKLETFTLKN